MDLVVREAQGRRFLEGVPGQTLMGHADDVVTVLEECFSHGIHRLLLYPENLTPRFFDLNSGEAGTILQKLRNYHIRFAIVCPPTMELSRRFRELMADEQADSSFRLFSDRAAAQDWLNAD